MATMKVAGDVHGPVGGPGMETNESAGDVAAVMHLVGNVCAGFPDGNVLSCTIYWNFLAPCHCANLSFENAASKEGQPCHAFRKLQQKQNKPNG